MRPPLPADGGRSGGFALIIVLWTLVLIAFVTAHLVASGRTEIRIAENLAANAVTEAAADGAIYQAVFNLSDANPEHRWPLDGSAHELTIGHCRVSVRLADEAARIDPNLASPLLMEALLRVTGSDPASASRLAAAIAEWVGAPTIRRDPNTVLAEYRDAGFDYGPPGEPLETLDELRRVRGMTPAIFAAIRPHLSLFAPAEPNLEHADPVVTAAMAAVGQVGTRSAVAGGDILTVRIAVVVRGPNNARAQRTAIVRIIPQAANYTVLAWDDADG